MGGSALLALDEALGHIIKEIITHSSFTARLLFFLLLIFEQLVGLLGLGPSVPLAVLEQRPRHVSEHLFYVLARLGRGVEVRRTYPGREPG